jgi:hypothetical protein
MALERLMRKGLQVAEERGTPKQQNDMDAVVAQTARIIGELSDLMGGRRKQKDLQHHPAKDLSTQAISGIEDIVKLRKEIEES